ncbi:MAG: hypothetical protein A2X49_06850 [Lentisphaerae bacterium GWF2_52_8]|nr:MAG: hypothetical protein A2X49_06850 [Lentisphaerae bacterium GWF2_52_8]
MNNTSEFAAKLKSAAEIIVLCDMSDLQSLSRLHTIFQEIAAMPLPDAPMANAAAAAAVSLVEKMVLNEISDTEIALQTLNQTISMLQLLADGRPSNSIVFPKALGISPTEEAASTSEAPAAPLQVPPPSPPAPAMQAAPLNQTPASGSSDKARIEEAIATALSSSSELAADFVNESNEHLETCNERLLTLENDSQDMDALNAVFRSFHTIKGVASFLNLSDIRALAHQAENLLDAARSSKLILSGPLLDIVFESVDTMKAMIDDLANALKTHQVLSSVPSTADLISRLKTACEGKLPPAATPRSESVQAPSPPVPEKAGNVPGKEEPPPTPSRKAEASSSEEMFTHESVAQAAGIPKELLIAEMPRFIEELAEHIDIAEAGLMSLEKTPGQKDVIHALFRSFHTIKGSAGFLELHSIEKLAHKTESMLAAARDEKLEMAGHVLELVFQAVDALRKIHDTLKASIQEGKGKFSLPQFPRLELSLANALAHDAAAPKDVPNFVKASAPSQSLGASTIMRSGASDADEKLSATSAMKLAADDKMSSTSSIRKNLVKETVKVDSDRLDKLVDAIGELVIAETMITQSPEMKKLASPAILQSLNQLDKITRELQEMGTTLRMVPIRSTFQKMARLARDLAKKVDKDVDFIMSGEDTELDKTVVDRIGDPLVHMIRNSIDHGIERSSEERVKAGKAPKGRVELRAFHKAGSIFVEVVDDGRGLNKDAILKKALERGIINGGENLSDKEVFALIFEPGFSTAEVVTEVSGRGVGMDVVRRNIESLRGQIDIQSEMGKGSVFSIRLPLTLAIIDGMVVRIAAERYIIPTLSIVMSVRISRSDIKTVQKKGEFLSLQGELIPAFHLDRIFEISGKAAEEEDCLAVIVEDEGMKTALLLDELLGQQQIVIKSLGSYLGGLSGISGGAIMPDGTIGLILDVGGMVRLANGKNNLIGMHALQHEEEIS